MDALSQVEGEGWGFMQANYVFVQTGEDSRDEFLASGQRTAIKGRSSGSTGSDVMRKPSSLPPAVIGETGQARTARLPSFASTSVVVP